jgi:acylphosphatase
VVCDREQRVGGGAQRQAAMTGLGSAEPPRAARRAVVSGRVQGVWYRDSARRVAERLGVSGWAGNRADGTVELWAEGPREGVEALLEWCRTGPPRARVEHVAVERVAPAGIVGFQVR